MGISSISFPCLMNNNEQDFHYRLILKDNQESQPNFLLSLCLKVNNAVKNHNIITTKTTKRETLNVDISVFMNRNLFH